MLVHCGGSFWKKGLKLSQWQVSSRRGFKALEYLRASLPHACGSCKSHHLRLLFRRENGNEGARGSLADTVPEAQSGSVRSSTHVCLPEDDDDPKAGAMVTSGNPLASLLLLDGAGN